MTDRLLELLNRTPLVLGDGAMGTMLQQAGLTDGGAPELWNVTHPDAVRAIYQGYADAGSDIITANTFGGTHYRLKLHNLQDRVFELNQAGAALALAGDHRVLAAPGQHEISRRDDADHPRRDEQPGPAGRAWL